MRHRKLLIGIIITALLIVSLLVAAPLLLMQQMLDHHISYNSLYTGEEYGIEAVEHFVNTEDGLKIALYEVEVEGPKALIITLSGIEKPSGTAFMGHAAMFKQQGYASIMVEMRAHGRSEGDKICLGYKEPLDVAAALDYAKDKYQGIPIVIMGLSMGAGTAINAIAQYPEIDALISLSAFSSCEETFSEILAQSMPPFVASILKPFLYTATFLRYGFAVKNKPIKSIQMIGDRPALLMHTTEDSNVAYTNFLRLKAVAPTQVEFHTFDGDEHFITEEFLHPDQDERYSSIILSFIESIL